MDTLNRLVELQAEILEAGCDLVPNGGHLVYSTCTLEAEENQDQVEAFLTRHPDFSVRESGAVSRDHLDEKGYFFALPQKDGFDGAFAARLVRRS